MNDTTFRESVRGNVLGDPRLAMTWIANELLTHNIGLRASEIITGTSVPPSPSKKAATSLPTSAASEP